MTRGHAVRLVGHPGMAYRVVGQASYLDDEGERVEHDWLVVRAVGDDFEFEVDPDDVLPLERDAYCSECGQVGCTWGVTA